MSKESKREKFVRLSESRTNKAIHMIQLIGNCSNTAVYEYSDKDVDKICTAIELEIKKIRKLFDTKSDSKPEKFLL